MKIFNFKPRKIIDPRTKKERIISPQEQEEMLAKGVIFDAPIKPIKKKKN